tara:strand:- start:455 stop:619 length:165 start_codon:yes stop_codon:yes gene_type:complete
VGTAVTKPLPSTVALTFAIVKVPSSFASTHSHQDLRNFAAKPIVPSKIVKSQLN